MDPEAWEWRMILNQGGYAKLVGMTLMLPLVIGFQSCSSGYCCCPPAGSIPHHTVITIKQPMRSEVHIRKLGRH